MPPACHDSPQWYHRAPIPALSANIKQVIGQWGQRSGLVCSELLCNSKQSKYSAGMDNWKQAEDVDLLQLLDFKVQKSAP